MDFNGTSALVDCTYNPILDITDELTLSAWVKLGGGGLFEGGIVSKGYSANVPYNLGVWGDDKVQFRTYPDTWTAGPKTSTLTHGRWYNVVATYDKSLADGNAKIYLNGVFQNQATNTTGLPTNTTNTTIGYFLTRYFNGAIDEVRIYNRVLFDEIAYLYRNPSGAQANIPSTRIMITDLDDTDHVITENVQELETTTELSDATDSFSFIILNESDAYSYIEKGCAIEISTGMGSTTKKLDGFVTEVSKSLDDSQIKPIMSVSGEDGGIRLNHIMFSARFYDLEVSALVKAILDTTDYTTGQTYRTIADIDASNAYIEATAYTVNEATYVWKSLGAAIKELADNVGYGWYRDVDKKPHFFDPSAAAVTEQITDSDLEGSPEITDEGEIINRAVVIGGFQQNADQVGGTQTTTTTVTNAVAKNQSFVPTEDYLSSVLVYTELVTDSASSLIISIQADSAAAPDGKNVANGLKTLATDSITNAGYTEFRFTRDVTLTPGDTYWLVLKGSTSDGVDVGINGSAVLDYETRYPVRVAIMTNDDESQTKYGIYMKVHRDRKIEDSQYAEQIANSLLRPKPKKVANIMVRGDSVAAGDVVLLTLSESGIEINKNMKVISSTQTLGEVFIYNELELEEI